MDVIAGDKLAILQLNPIFKSADLPTSIVENVECGSCYRSIAWSVYENWALLLAGSDDGT